MDKEDQIMDSWRVNSQHWVEVIDNEEIASRKLITNQAIIDAVLAHQPKRALDVGCGEGWLTRTLVKTGVEVLGVDGAEGLIASAKSKGIGEFKVLEYKQFTQENLESFGQFDTIIFNYALFGNEIVEKVLQSLQPNLTPDGRIIIQTIHPQHPLVADLDEPTWLQENWAGLKRDFKNGYEWYFRPLDHWKNLFVKLNYQWKDKKDVLHPDQEEFISIIMEVGK